MCLILNLVKDVAICMIWEHAFDQWKADRSLHASSSLFITVTMVHHVDAAMHYVLSMACKSA